MLSLAAAASADGLHHRLRAHHGCLIAFVVFFTPHHNRKALDRSKASDRTPCRKALAHNLDRSAGARNLDLAFRTRDTHHAGVLCRPARRPRDTDR